jgi:HEAT repeat protein
VTHPIVARLRDPDPAVRRRACAEAVDDPSAVLLAGALLEALGDAEALVARAAADALAAIGRRDAGVGPLLSAALRGDRPDARCRAALTLARLEPPKIRLMPALVEGLGHPDRQLRWSCARLLVELGRTSPEVLPVLLHIGAGGERPEAQRMAVVALRELAPDRPETTRALLAASRSGDPDVRRTALPALAAVLEHTREAQARLREASVGDADAECRRLAAAALEALSARAAAVR